MGQCLPQEGSIIGLVRKQVSILALKPARRSVKLPAFLSPPHWYSSHILVCGQVSRVQTRTFAHLAAGCMRAKVCPLLYVNKGTHMSGRSLPGAHCCLLPEEGSPCDPNQLSPISFACPLTLGNQNMAFHTLRDGGLGIGVTELGAGDKT